MARAANGRRMFIKFSRCKLIPLRVVYCFGQSLWGPCKAVGRHQLFFSYIYKTIVVSYIYGWPILQFFICPFRIMVICFFNIFSTALHMEVFFLMGVVGYVIFVAHTCFTQIEKLIYQTMCQYTGTDIFGRG